MLGRGHPSLTPHMLSLQCDSRHAGHRGSAGLPGPKVSRAVAPRAGVLERGHRHSTGHGTLTKQLHGRVVPWL